MKRNRKEYLKKWKMEKALSDPDYFKRASEKAYEKRKALLEQNPELKRIDQERSKISSMKRRHNNPERVLLYEARKRAKKKNIECSINIEDIFIPDFCPVLKIPIIFGRGKRLDNSPSIDRIDNTKGYTKENICVISFRANALKNNATIEELMAIVNYMECKNGVVRN